MVGMNDESDRSAGDPDPRAGGADGEAGRPEEDLPFDDADAGTGGGGEDPLDPDADPFKPPAIPTEVCCLHCGREYESYLIEWRVKRCDDGFVRGFWCCPTPGCDGAGFGFDLFPTDPDYIGEDGEPMGLFLEEDEAWDEEGEGCDPDGGAWGEDLPPRGDDGDDLPFDEGSDIPY